MPQFRETALRGPQDRPPVSGPSAEARSGTDQSRRRFLTTVAAAAPMLFLPKVLFAETGAPRTLNFLHTHTSERLAVEYFSGGQYLPDALTEVNRFLRDFRTGDVHAIEPGLLDLLHQLAGTTGASRPFQVISGYRSPATNAMLRAHSEGVASGSLHMQGQAIDIRVPGVKLNQLRDAARSLKLGGVGFYPDLNFVHVDVGRVRYW